MPGVAQAEGEIKGALASEEDLPIAGYDDLTAEEIIAKLPELSQIDLAKVDAYERRHAEPHDGARQDQLAARRRAVARLRRAERRGDPAVLREADADTVEKVRKYERAHKNRSSVLKATERKLAAVS